MNTEFILGVLMFSFGMSATPGPNNTIAFSTGLNYGFKHSVPYAFGVSAGVPLMIVAVAWGFGEFFAVFPVFYDYIRYAGVAYILYLSWKIASASVERKSSDAASSERCPTFLNGVLFQWMNPKAWLLAVTGVTTYIGRDLLSSRLFFMCGAFCVMCLLSLVVWSLAGRISGSFIQSARVLRAVNLSMGLLLASSVLTLF